MDKLEIIMNGLFSIKAEGELSVVAASILGVVLVVAWGMFGGRSGRGH